MSIIDEPRAWDSTVDGQYLKTHPSNTSGTPLYVFPVTTSGATPVLEYSSISSLASGTLTTILSYTVPVGKTLTLNGIEASGCNVAIFSLEINSVVKGTKRTYFGNFNVEFNTGAFKVDAGIVVRVRVIHSRPNAGNFEATLIGSIE